MTPLEYIIVILFGICGVLFDAIVIKETIDAVRNARNKNK